VRLLLAWIAVAAIAAGASTANAASSIEGVWSFGGGQIAIQAAPNGTFFGTVVAATTFAECAHPIGQEIWKGIRLQLDGSYWGEHQWYYAGTCVENPALGPTAWRVDEEPGGAKYLRVCLSRPETSQPTIPANGPEVNVTYGCINSKLIAPLPPSSGVASFQADVEQCRSARLFEIHLREPKYDPFKTIRVTLRGRRLATVRRGNYVVATVDLKGLGAGTLTVRVTATTVLGVRLSGRRTYHTCANKPRKHRPTPLKTEHADQVVSEARGRNTMTYR
jgi:hypothetical protein